MDLKNSLKLLKIYEPIISAILGAIVIISIGLTVYNYFGSNSSGNITSTGAQTESSTNTNSLTKYKVAEGDSLWKIAETQYKSGYAWVDIAKANKIVNPNILLTGQELELPILETKETAQVLPPPTTEQISAIPNTSTSQSEPTTITGETYKIVKGDSLWKISVRAFGDGYRWPEIAKLNNLKNPNLIYPDSELKLPSK